MCPAVPTTIDRMSPPSTATSGVSLRLPVAIGAARRLRRSSIPPLPGLSRSSVTSRLPPAPHDVENLAQPEIDLPALHVDADHLHLDAIPEAVDAAVLLAAQD